jgi:PAS domain S-box-containing protein
MPSASPLAIPEARQRALFDQVGAVQLLLDPETGLIVDANPAAVAFYGYSRDRLRGMALTGINTLPAEEVHQATRLAATVGGHYRGFPHRLASGELRLVEIYAGPVDLAGRTLVHEIIHDVTEQIRTERAREEAEARLRLLVEHVPAAVAMLDRERRFLVVSQRWLSDYRLRPEDILGRPFEQVFPGAPPEWSAVQERALAGGVERRDAQRVVMPDGREEWLRWDVLPWRADTGEIGGLVLLTEFVTARRQAEESNRRLGAVAVGVAHEVRNPLFGISSTLDAFRARFGDRPEFAPYLRVLGDQVDRLSRLMRDLLEYGKPQALELVPGHPAGPITQALLYCQPLADAANVTLANASDPACPPIMLDGARMVQLLQNLIENAVQHSPAGGTVSVSCGPVEAEGWRGVEIRVEDQGPGFRTEDRTRIFEPFFTRRQGGTGLGLAIVQRIVVAHGGHIEAANLPGGGASIRARFPALPHS